MPVRDHAAVCFRLVVMSFQGAWTLIGHHWHIVASFNGHLVPGCSSSTAETQLQNNSSSSSSNAQTFIHWSSIVAQSLLNQHITESSTHYNEIFTISNTVGFKRRASWYKHLDDEPRRAHTTTQLTLRVTAVDTPCPSVHTH